MKRTRRAGFERIRPGKEPSLSKILLVSAILHVFFVALVTVPIKTKERDYRIYTVKLVGPFKSQEGEIIGPASKSGKAAVLKTEKPVAELKKAPEAAVSKPVPKADITLEETAMVAKEIERLQAISRLSKKLRQEKTEKKAAEIKKIQIGIGRPLERTAESSGAGDETPPGGEEAGTVSYNDVIEQAIQKAWVYPKRDAAGLEAIITITINKDGKIFIKEIKKSSGDMLYDRSAIKAVNSASPLPPPPEGFDTDIDLGF